MGTQPDGYWSNGQYQNQNLIRICPNHNQVYDFYYILLRLLKNDYFLFLFLQVDTPMCFHHIYMHLFLVDFQNIKVHFQVRIYAYHYLQNPKLTQ